MDDPMYRTATQAKGLLNSREEPLPPAVEVIDPGEPIDYGKGKAPTRQSIIRALQRRDGMVPGATLTDAADSLIEAAVNGSLAAWRELRDTLDGKPAPEIALAPGTELGVQYVLRGPPVCKTREEYCQLTGTTVYQEPDKKAIESKA